MPDYRKLASDMVDLAAGGPIATLRYGARGIAGDTLFPMERTTRMRDYQRQLQQQRQQLPGTDVVPVNTFDERFNAQR